MSMHGTALWSHVVLAILLVGGSAWSHVAATGVRRSRTVDEARAHAATVHAFVRASGPLAAGVLVAGAYLATVGSHWSSPWLVASLVLFTAIGALSGTRVQPAHVRRGRRRRSRRRARPGRTGTSSGPSVRRLTQGSRLRSC